MFNYCALCIVDQAVSTLVLAANVASLGLTTPAVTGATATIRVGGKTVAGTSKVGKALVSAVSKLQTIKPGNLEKGASIVKRIIKARTGTKLREIATNAKIANTAYKAMKQYRETFADDFGEQTSPEIEEELDSHFHPTTARFLKELWGERMINDLAEANKWQLASTTLAAASIVDITGVTGVVSAYAKPVCSTIVHFPCTSADLKCNGGSGGDDNGGDGATIEKEPIRFRSTTNKDGKVTQPTYIQVSGGGWNKVHCASTSRVLEDGESFTVRGNKLQAGVGLCIDSQELQDGGKCGIRFNHSCVGFYGDNRNLMFAADESGKEYKISADNNMSAIQGITYDKEGNCVRHASSRTQQCVPLPEHFKDKPLRATGQVWNSARATIV